MQKGVRIICLLLYNKVIATLPRQLTLAVLWTVTLCQWFWVKTRLWVHRCWKASFSFHKKTVYEFLKPNLDKMKTVHFTWCKVLFTMQKGVLSCIRCLLLYNKVIATLPRQLTLAVLWTVILCQWFWMKEENVGPQMLKSCFSFHKKTFYEFLNQILTKWKLLISHDVKSYLLCRKA